MRSLLLLLGCVTLAWAARATEFELANQLYDQGKFAEAKAGYERVIATGQGNANTFYNLGNASVRLELPGEGLLNYERALTLDPAHPEARANRELVRSQTGAVAWPVGWMERVFPERWVNAITLTGCGAAWVAIFLLASIFIVRRRGSASAWTGVIAALLVAGYAAAAVWHAEQARTRAMVTAKSAEVHLAPAESAAPGGTLPAGSEVRLLSERGDWVYCALPTSGRGWLPARAVARVRIGTL